MDTIRICVAGACLASCAVGSVTAAQGLGGSSECAWGEDRQLGDHTFLTPTFVDSALVLSYLGVRAGLEFENTPDVELADITLDIDRVRLGASIDGGIKVLDRLGVFLNLSAVAAASTNSKAVLTRGSDYILSGNLGAIFEIARFDGTDTLLSARAFVGTESGDIATLLPLIDRLGDAPVRTTAEILDSGLAQLLLVPYSAFNWGASVAAAQPFSSVLSGQASIGVAVANADLEPYDDAMGETATIEWTTVRPQLGLAAAGDARTLGLPFAAMLEYQFTLSETDFDDDTEASSDVSHVIGLGVYYSGRSDLQAGLFFYRAFDYETLLKRTSEDDAPANTPSFNGARLILRYFW